MSSPVGCNVATLEKIRSLAAVCNAVAHLLNAVSSLHAFLSSYRLSEKLFRQDGIRYREALLRTTFEVNLSEKSDCPGCLG